MDENFIERAEALTRAEVEHSLTRIRSTLQDKKPDFFDGSCEICGEPVPQRRSALGYYRCIDCQSRIEKMRRK